MKLLVKTHSQAESMVLDDGRVCPQLQADSAWNLESFMFFEDDVDGRGVHGRSFGVLILCGRGMVCIEVQF